MSSRFSNQSYRFVLDARITLAVNGWKENERQTERVDSRNGVVYRHLNSIRASAQIAERIMSLQKGCVVLRPLSWNLVQEDADQFVNIEGIVQTKV